MSSRISEDDKRTWEMGCAGLLEPWDYLHLARPRRKRKPRGPSPSKLIAAAVKAGKPLTSLTLPDGTVLHFGASEPTVAVNPWLADLDKVTKQ